MAESGEWYPKGVLENVYVQSSELDDPRYSDDDEFDDASNFQSKELQLTIKEGLPCIDISDIGAAQAETVQLEEDYGMLLSKTFELSKTFDGASSDLLYEGQPCKDIPLCGFAESGHLLGNCGDAQHEMGLFEDALQSSPSTSGLLPESRKHEPHHTLEMWTEHTQSQLSIAQSLREDVSQVLLSPLVQHNRSCASNMSVASNFVQQKLKREIQKAEHMNRVLFARVEQTRHTIQQVGGSISILLKAYHDKDAPLRVAELRLDLRAERPRKESMQDHVQDALENERTMIVKARQRIAKYVQDGQELLQSVEDCKTQLLACVKNERDLVRLDRSCLLFDGFHTEEGVLKRKEKAQRSKLKSGAMGDVHTLIEKSGQLQQFASKFLRESDELVLKSKRSVEQLGFVTNKCIGKRVTEIVELKRKIERESVESACAIKQMEQSLQIMEAQLRGNAATSPRSRTRLTLLLQEPHKHLAPESVGLLEDLGNVTHGVVDRAMAAAGNKQGLVGLQRAERILAPHAEVIGLALSKVEDELAESPGPLVVRRLHQIASKLAGQQESVESELDIVRAAKMSVTEALEERVEWGTERLGQLRACLEQIEEDKSNKTAAWKIDVRCASISVSNVEDGPQQPPQTANNGQQIANNSRPNTTPRNTKTGSSQRPRTGSQLQPRTPRPYRSPLPAEVLVVLKEKIRAASYTGHGGCELDVVFRRFDKGGSGELDESQFRMCLRRSLRVPPMVISDPQISSLLAIMDKNGNGRVAVTELVDFLGPEPEYSKRTGQSLHGGSLLEPANMAGISGNTKSSSSGSKSWQSKPARPYSAPLKKAALEALRTQIKSASYTGVFGRQLDVVFQRFDKDGSGQLEDDEVRQALRRVLRIPPAVVSDAQIIQLCAILDKENSGAVSISELIDFVGDEPEVSARTGKKVLSMSSQAAELLADVGLPQVSQGGKSTISDAAAGIPEESVDSALPPVTPGRVRTADVYAQEPADATLPPVTQGRVRPADTSAQDPSLFQALPNSVGRPPVVQSQVLPNLAG